ncbi:hypothetical protein Q7O_003146 [Pectobacterium carotovorum subsp. carotovorum PCCS1]|nr:hypothetical protein [Pectobacterium carotovorum subsp. carotovorum PCCS1]
MVAALGKEKMTKFSLSRTVFLTSMGVGWLTLGRQQAV